MKKIRHVFCSYSFRMRTMVFGDIHGAYRALEQLLEEVKPTAGDKLVFLGDYVDGWPQSAQVIELLLQLSQQFECVFLMGNHDLWCRDWLNSKQASPAWLQNKGDTTIASYGQYNQETLDRHVHFFNQLKDYYVDGSNRLYIHAGFTSMDGPEHEASHDTCFNDRTLIELVVCMNEDLSSEHPFYPKRLKLFREIYIGHTPTLRYGITEPLHKANLWDMDTGVSKGGKLSAMDVDSKQIWQSQRVEELYASQS
ncbi:metallophosphoesterase family protein [Olivibacter sitiensis]|uniref:metallophosphoesterase family protein n=1 Tax=Olivibacter sitiensis TaxID=376470 RepID=UPI001B7FEE77|nr:metallophosphoesterase family protein [Olivibacter sitiensis]